MKNFTIPKGWHYAKFLFGRLGGWHYNKKRFHISFMFDTNCYWSSPRNDDDYDLNKLYGISFGLFNIHKNSVRLAWRPRFGYGDIMIFAYIYDNKNDKHISEYITTVNTNQLYEATIEINPGVYRFIVDGKIFIITNTSPDKKIQKELYPYFGGNNTAINTMSIFAKFNTE